MLESCETVFGEPDMEIDELCVENDYDYVDKNLETNHYDCCNAAKSILAYERIAQCLHE